MGLSARCGMECKARHRSKVHSQSYGAIKCKWHKKAWMITEWSEVSISTECSTIVKNRGASSWTVDPESFLTSNFQWTIASHCATESLQGNFSGYSKLEFRTKSNLTRKLVFSTDQPPSLLPDWFPGRWQVTNSHCSKTVFIFPVSSVKLTFLILPYQKFGFTFWRGSV